MRELTDATVFSQFYPIALKRAVAKTKLEEMLQRLLQSIGKPLAHNGIIIGHIKLLAELSKEEFLFLSLTRLERVDITASADWAGKGDDVIGLDLKINVLVFDHSKSYIAEIVNASLEEFYNEA